MVKNILKAASHYVTLHLYSLYDGPGYSTANKAYSHANKQCKTASNKNAAQKSRPTNPANNKLV